MEYDIFYNKVNKIMEKLTMFDNKRCNLTYYNFVKQSKAIIISFK